MESQFYRVLDDDNLLWEILLRLPPQPSSLLRASAVCTRWRRLATDPKFIGRFRAHHLKPPLLGVFHRSNQGIVFVPILDHPDRIPSERFDMRSRGNLDVLGCRHGRLLAMDWCQGEVVVCDPVTGDHHRVSVPPAFRLGLVNGAALCPAAHNEGHVHCGGCPFKVILLNLWDNDHRPAACVYCSQAGTWGELVKTAAPCQFADADIPATLLGETLHWLQLHAGDDILVFDLKSDLAVIKGPPVTDDFRNGSSRIIQAEAGALGLAVLSYQHLQIWQRYLDCSGVATWVVSQTVEIHNIFGIPRTVTGCTILGYSEDHDTLFLLFKGNVYMVQLKSMQSRKLHEARYINSYHPFTTFLTPGGL